MIQALQVKHPILELLRAHDYDSFFESELAGRKEFGYPPFTRLIQITLKHKDKNKVSQAAAELNTFLQQDLRGMITGPAEPIISRIRNQYLMEFLIKLPKDHRLPAFKKVILNHIQLMHSDKRFGSVQVIADADPV
jgi:primosomal protein N' (replication factor Y)